MLPVVAIVGRPNVGKSSLFNKLTASRQALVVDVPGVTRDRQYAEADYANRKFTLVDTGGIGESDGALEDLTSTQVQQAVQDADVILFVVDASAGLTASDQKLVDQLRRLQQEKTIVLLVNKSDRMLEAEACSDFYGLGLGAPHAVSASSGRGLQAVISEFVPNTTDAVDVEPQDAGIRLAFIGRPNVGKSTLVNRLLGEDRMVVLDKPGTTIDSISVPFEYRGTKFTLVDTAGIRRKSRVNETVETFSIVKSLQAIQTADVCCVLLDSQAGLNEQDQRLLGLALEKASGIILVLNKWDGLQVEERDQVRTDLDRRFNFSDFVPIMTISALHGTGCGELLLKAKKVYESANQEFTTPQLTKLLEQAIKTHQPPMVSGRRIRLRYAHIGSNHPLSLVIHGKQLQRLPKSYLRFLSAFFRKHLRIVGVPLHVRCVNDGNPYVENKDKK